MSFPKQEEFPQGNSWAETRDLQPRDRLLREHGFQIAARPRAGPGGDGGAPASC